VRHHPRTYRVEFDVTLAGEQVLISIHQRGMKAPLPESAGTALTLIHQTNVAAVHRLHHPRQPSGHIRRRQKMDVVAHQHVGMNPAVVFFGAVAQQAQVNRRITAVEEHGLAVVAALDNVLRIPGRVDATGAWHGHLLGQRDQSPLLSKGI